MILRRQLQIPAAVVALALVLAGSPFAADLALPNKKDSLHFAVIGDSGTGGPDQLRVASQLTAMRSVFSYDTVLMLGDNLYGGGSAKAYADEFEKPYQTLLSSGVK